MKSKKIIKNKFLSILLDTTAIALLIGICFCRFYLGRHSVDQIILGLALGLAMAHFYT